MTITTATARSISRMRSMVERPPALSGSGVAMSIAPASSVTSVGMIGTGVLVAAIAGASGVGVGGLGVGVAVASGVFVTVGTFESASVPPLGISRIKATASSVKIKRLQEQDGVLSGWSDFIFIALSFRW